MLGSMIVFVVVVLIVTAYMTIVHRFLSSAEEPGDFEQPAKPVQPAARKSSGSARPQWAH